MNAGCYGSYTADHFVSATVVMRDGSVTTIGKGEAGFAYRSSALPEGAVIVEAVLEGEDGDPALLNARMEEQLARRDATQPVKDRSAGSTFRNPAGYSSTGRADDVHDLKAWTLIGPIWALADWAAANQHVVATARAEFYRAYAGSRTVAEFRRKTGAAPESAAA